MAAMAGWSATPEAAGTGRTDDRPLTGNGGLGGQRQLYERCFLGEREVTSIHAKPLTHFLGGSFDIFSVA